MGLGGRDLEIYPKIQTGDIGLVYIKKKAVFSGLFKTVNKNSKQKFKWKHGQYQKLLELKPIIFPSNPILIKPHINNLKFFPDEDLEYIINLMKKVEKF